MGKKRAAELTGKNIASRALKLTDRIGIEAFSIRKLAEELNAGTMSVYYYFKSKEAIIDAMVDEIFGEIALPPEDMDWKAAIRIRCESTREVLNRHKWASSFMESRKNPGPLTLKHHDAMIGCFIKAGFSIDLVARAVAVTDAFVYGFALQEASLPGGGGDEMIEMAREMAKGPFQNYPHLLELSRYTFGGNYRFRDTFDFGLSLMLDSLEKESGI